MRIRKVPMTTLLRAVGLSSDEDILSLFDNDVYLKNTIEKDSTHNTDEALIEIYEKLSRRAYYFRQFKEPIDY